MWEHGENTVGPKKTPQTYTGFQHMLSTCQTIILTKIRHLAATVTCVGMMQRSQVNVLYLSCSTPGQTEAHAVLYSSQECIHNSFHMPRFCLPIMRQKKGTQFYNSALVEGWTCVSLKFLSNEHFAPFGLWPACSYAPTVWSPPKNPTLSPFMASWLPHYLFESAKQILVQN